MIKKILIVLSISISFVFSCTCPSSNPGTPSQLKADPTFELEEVIVDGVNYGKEVNAHVEKEEDDQEQAADTHNEFLAY